MKRVVWLPLLCSLLVTPSRGADSPPKPLIADDPTGVTLVAQ